MKNLILLTVCLVYAACSSTPEKKSENTATDTTINSNLSVARAEQPSTIVYDTVTQLENMSDTIAYFRDPEGEIYKVTLLPDADSRSNVTAKLTCDTTIFLGTDRRNPKTTKLSKTFQTYANVVAMTNTLQTDSFMRHHNPPVTSDTNSVRVDEEKRNVIITTAWLYAIKREDDNDFHLIIGKDTTPTANELFNVEVSGLPATSSSSYSTLKMVRDAIVNRFGQICKTSYTQFSPPMKISVRGSLFYDIDHAPGAVGPAGFRPPTSWEIHPVTKISFK